MNEHPLEKLRRLLGEQWSPQWVANEAIERACAEIERLRAHRAEQVAPDMVLVPRVPAEKLQAHLTGMLVASCNCDTKPPDVEYHEIWCRYRQTSEAVELIDTMLSAIERTGPHHGEGKEG